MTKITKAPAFMTGSGQATRYTLDNGTIRADICDFGALILTLLVPDRDGRLADVVLGYDGYEGYRERVTFFGAAVGRCPEWKAVSACLQRPWRQSSARRQQRIGPEAVERGGGAGKDRGRAAPDHVYG